MHDWHKRLHEGCVTVDGRNPSKLTNEETLCMPRMLFAVIDEKLFKTLQKLKYLLEIVAVLSSVFDTCIMFIHKWFQKSCLQNKKKCEWQQGQGCYGWYWSKFSKQRSHRRKKQCFLYYPQKKHKISEQKPSLWLKKFCVDRGKGTVVLQFFFYLKYYSP